MLPLLAINVILLLHLYQQRTSRNLPAISVWVLALLSVFSVAGLHDWYSLQRARVTAADVLARAGVPRTAVHGGLKYDGWTQITTAGFIPYYQPLGPVFRPGEYDSDLPSDCYSSLNQYTPVVHPKYYVVFSRLPCFQPSSFAPIPYQAWLPPFHREIFIEKHR